MAGCVTKVQDWAVVQRASGTLGISVILNLNWSLKKKSEGLVRWHMVGCLPPSLTELCRLVDAKAVAPHRLCSRATPWSPQSPGFKVEAILLSFYTDKVTNQGLFKYHDGNVTQLPTATWGKLPCRCCLMTPGVQVDRSWGGFCVFFS